MGLVLCAVLWAAAWSARAESKVEEANIARVTANLLQRPHFSANHAHQDV